MRTGRRGEVVEGIMDNEEDIVVEICTESALYTNYTL